MPHRLQASDDIYVNTKIMTQFIIKPRVRLQTEQAGAALIGLTIIFWVGKPAIFTDTSRELFSLSSECWESVSKQTSLPIHCLLIIHEHRLIYLIHRKVVVKSVRINQSKRVLIDPAIKQCNHYRVH